MFNKQSRKWIIFSSLLALGIIFAGFIDFGETNSDKDDNTSSINTSQQEKEQTNEKTRVEPIEITQKNIQNYIDATMTRTEIENLLGLPNAVGEFNGVWRYDVKKNEGYEVYNGPEELVKYNGSSVIDYEGFKNEDLQLQLFIKWNNDLSIEQLTLYYNENGKVVKYDGDSISEFTIPDVSVSTAKVGDNIVGWTITEIKDESWIDMDGDFYYRVFATAEGVQELSGQVSYSALFGEFYFQPDEKSKALIPSITEGYLPTTMIIKFTSDSSKELEQVLIEAGKTKTPDGDVYSTGTATITTSKYLAYHIEASDAMDVIYVSDIKDFQLNE
ncbi:hypothetical protein VQL36_11330 [Chengkuizengella sp. SCS-71B]|uniref:hypothetical protein n=1 Tax=Chengkuizengella sp. SCS-71B TaxID=3115290 RepID=UPI0032C22FB5